MVRSVTLLAALAACTNAPESSSQAVDTDTTEVDSADLASEVSAPAEVSRPEGYCVGHCIEDHDCGVGSICAEVSPHYRTACVDSESPPPVDIDPSLAPYNLCAEDADCPRRMVCTAQHPSRFCYRTCVNDGDCPESTTCMDGGCEQVCTPSQRRVSRQVQGYNSCTARCTGDEDCGPAVLCLLP